MPDLTRADAVGFLRSVLNLPLIAGAVITVLGFGQFFFFMLLDKLGIVEVGNALGHGLILYCSVPLGGIFLFLGLVIALVRIYRSREMP